MNHDSLTTFDELGLAPVLLNNLKTQKYTHPTPIQKQAIPHILAGKDLLGVAQTGTGKTAAFALPLLQLIAGNRKPLQPGHTHALILAPTRELAAQIQESFIVYGRSMGLRYAVVFGGVGQQPQVTAMKHGVDVLIATPGRLLDLMQQRFIFLHSIKYLVLDEADRMLDMGFIRDIRKILSFVPKSRQTLFFSATMPQDVVHLARNILTNPVSVSVTPQSPTVEKIDQKVYYVDRTKKVELLAHLLLDQNVGRAIVFTRTKHVANKVAQILTRENLAAEAIHSNKSQSARTKALDSFRRGHTRVLVATDIVSRGIDVDNITHVINYDIPHEPESYVHRIGRTARAGAEGKAISLCSGDERPLIRDIERVIKRTIPVETDHKYHSQAAEKGEFSPQKPQNRHKKKIFFGRRRR